MYKFYGGRVTTLVLPDVLQMLELELGNQMIDHLSNSSTKVGFFRVKLDFTDSIFNREAGAIKKFLPATKSLLDSFEKYSCPSNNK